MATVDPTRTDSLFGMHANALALQQKRMDVLASNLANADTPHYQARDIDFAKVLASQQPGQGGHTSASLMTAGTMTTTHAGHIATSTPASALHDPGLVYRVPMQPSVDGNTVDEQIEQGKFADAALHYQASLTFLNDRVKEMTLAIVGQ
jgi:flagellar basal-body rod protein FlgB